MKTTGGKTRTNRRNRNVRIYSERGLTTVVVAASLKDGLQQYYNNSLRGLGYTEPQYTGNTMTVELKGRIYHYNAQEVAP